MVSHSLAIPDDTNLTSTELTVVFPAGNTSEIQCSNITIRDDEVLEGTQDFTVTITEAGSYALINTSSSSTTITLGDDEGIKNSIVICDFLKFTFRTSAH